MLPTVTRLATGVRFKAQPRAGYITPEKFKMWQPTLALWGGGAAVAVALFMSSVPIFQNDLLKKVPGLAAYYQDTTPDSDKPF